MDDPRPRVTVDKPIDLAVLDAELGGVGLSASHDDNGGHIIEVVAPEDVTESALLMAVEAHVAPDPPPTEGEQIAALQATVQQLLAMVNPPKQQ